MFSFCLIHFYSCFVAMPHTLGCAVSLAHSTGNEFGVSWTLLTPVAWEEEIRLGELAFSHSPYFSALALLSAATEILAAPRPPVHISIAQIHEAILYSLGFQVVVFILTCMGLRFCGCCSFCVYPGFWL